MSATIVCSVWNQRADWLLEAINSVDAPLLLGDDGSDKNETLNVLSHFELMSFGPTVRHYPHRGMEPTLNALIAEATTEYVSILDSDDRRIKGSLAQQCAFMDLTPETVACHGRFNYVDETGRVTHANMMHPTPCHSSLVFRKSAWEKVGGYPTGFEFGEGDSGFLARLAEVGAVMALPILCAERRVHPNSLSFPKQPRLQRIHREANEGT